MTTRLLKAESERDQALSDLSAVREMLAQCRSDTKNWRPALASAEAERDQARAEVKRLQANVDTLASEDCDDVRDLRAAARVLLDVAGSAGRSLPEVKALEELL